MLDWDVVEDRIGEAKGIAFDTCHKIYVLMDDAQMAQMKEYGYDPLISASEMSSSEMFAAVKRWYEESCPLKFIEAVSTTAEGIDPNEGFEVLIGQGDSDEEECRECGEDGCDGWECQRDRCEKCGDDDVYDDEMCRDCYDDAQETED